MLAKLERFIDGTFYKLRLAPAVLARVPARTGSALRRVQVLAELTLAGPVRVALDLEELVRNCATPHAAVLEARRTRRKSSERDALYLAEMHATVAHLVRQTMDKSTSPVGRVCAEIRQSGSPMEQAALISLQRSLEIVHHTGMCSVWLRQVSRAALEMGRAPVPFKLVKAPPALLAVSTLAAEVQQAAQSSASRAEFAQFIARRGSETRARTTSPERGSPARFAR